YHSASLLSSRWGGAWGPRPRRHRARGERRAREQRAALEEEAQLTQREHPSGRRRAVRRPERRKPPLLEPLVVHAQPGAVPQQHLRPSAEPIDEEKAVAGQRIRTQLCPAARWRRLYASTRARTASGIRVVLPRCPRAATAARTPCPSSPARSRRRMPSMSHATGATRQTGYGEHVRSISSAGGQ